MRSSILLSSVSQLGLISTVASWPGRPHRPFEIIDSSPSCTAIKRGESTEVGEACAKFTSDKLVITTTLPDTRNCMLKKVHFCNLPFVSPEGLNAKSFKFDLPLSDIANYLCGFEDEYSMISGNVAMECINDDVTYQYDDYFSFDVRCNNDESSSSPALPPAPAEKAVEKAVMSLPQPIDFTKTRNLHLHIPKSGGWSVKFISRHLLSQVLGSEELGKASFCDLPPRDEIFHDSSGVTWDKYKEDTGCSFISAECHYKRERDTEVKIPFDRVFTMLRDPLEHVVSQYFHCKESRESEKRAQGNSRGQPFYVPPTLDEWLETWVQVKRKERKAPEEYTCFNPTNMQNAFLGNPTVEELGKRYETVGVTSRLETSVCVEIITLTGRLPQSCNCTNGVTEDHRTKNLRRLESSGEEQSSGIYNVKRDDHGVKHHGSTFKPTEKQIELITELTDKDRLLFKEATRVFEEQVARIEADYGIRLC